jgi:phosphatidyl-myo-inositol dimannoside synthase
VTRVCVFSVSFPSQDGGIAVYAMEVARGLAARGIPVVVGAGSTDPQKDREIDAGLPYPVIRFPRVKNKAANLFYRVRALAACVRRLRPELVLAMDWYGAGTVAWALSGPLGFRYAVAAHGNEILQCRSNAILRAMCRVVMAGASRVIANSGSTSELVQEIVGVDVPVRTIPVGVSPSLLLSPMSPAALRQQLGVSGRPVILSLGRLVRRKGHDRIMQAMPEVIRAVPDAVWLIAGKGAYEDTLRGMAKTLSLEKHVVFLGYVDTPLKGAYYGLCDVYVLVPRTIEAEAEVEGFGIAFLEASLAGKPIVAGRSGGVSDAVIDGETGILVDPESPAEIASAVVRLLQNPHEARRLGENGRNRVLTGFTWDHTLARLVEVLGLEDGNGPPRGGTDKSDPGGER